MYGKAGVSVTENKTMKRKLIIQSFAPLFLILAIKNLSGELIPPVIMMIEYLKKHEWRIFLRIIKHPLFFTYVLEVICVVWIIYALISLHSFKESQTANFASQGEKIKTVNDISDSGVAFFMTYLLPMIWDNAGTLQEFAVFVLLMVMLCGLMWRTNLYFQNPILTILGYDIISFRFQKTELRDFQGKECIGITRGEIKADAVIKRQYIADNVFLIYQASTDTDEKI